MCSHFVNVLCGVAHMPNYGRYVFEVQNDHVMFNDDCVNEIRIHGFKSSYELVPCLHNAPRMLPDRERVHRIALI